MARTLIVKIIGDADSLVREFRRSSAAASKFNRDVSQATRGALAGSGAFRGFGRSLAFASGGFIAFASGTAFLRASVDAAREAVVAHRSLAAQMKASGDSFEANRAQIEKVSVSYGKFGFENDEVVAGLTVLERGTSDINKSFGLLGLTADLARAKQLHFADAANVLAKVFGGQETALRRAVPGLAKNAHGWDLIRLAQERLAGQAAANTTEAERFAATLHNTEEIIGTALLPVLNKYLGQLGDWLEKMNESGKLQKDVNTVAGAAVGIFNALAGAIGGVTSAWQKLSDFNKSLDPRKIFGPLPFGIGGGGGGGDFGSGIPGIGGGGNFPLTPTGRDAIRRRRPQPTSLQGRFNLAELQLAQAQVTATLADDRRILTAEQAITKQQIAQTKTLKERTALTQQLAQIVGRIRGIDEASANAAKFAADETKRRRQEAAQRRREAALEAAQLHIPLGLQVAEARGIALGQDVKPIQKRLRDAIRKALKSGKLSMEAQIQAWNEIASLNSRLKDGIEGARVRFRLVDPQSFVEALGGGLSGAQKRRLEMGLATIGPRGTVPPGRPRDFAGVVVHGDVHVHGVQDVRAFENELAKRNRGRPTVRRGAR